MLGSSILYLKGMRIWMFWLLLYVEARGLTIASFYCGDLYHAAKLHSKY